jgi:hypothetical protein
MAERLLVGAPMVPRRLMKNLVCAGSTALVLFASPLVADAEPIIFDYTGNLVTFTVPANGVYQILAFGAQGGITAGDLGVGIGGFGRGAEIGGDFSLTAGEILQIAVGGAGMPGSGTDRRGGGGGSFVAGPGSTPLVIAGGGGGSGYFFGLPGLAPPSVLSGQAGLTGPNGGNAHGQPGTGGSAGGGANAGGGGGGFLSAGGGPNGGGAFPDLAGGIGLFGGGSGGFGGGGGTFGGGGGGGGYSGGNGGGCSHETCDAGGGGGSFDAGTDQILIAGFQTGNGQVIITELASEVPEPASLVLLSAGLAGLAATRKTLQRLVGRRSATVRRVRRGPRQV